MSDTEKTPHSFLPETAVTEGGCGYINIYHPPANQTGRIYWQFMPIKNNPPIILAKMVSDTILMAVDQDARISLHDVIHKKKLAWKELSAKEPAGAGFSKSRNSVLIGLFPENDRHKHLLEIDAQTLDVKNNICIPEKAKVSHLTVLNEHQVLIYFPPGGSIGNEVNDGFYKIDLDDKKIETLYFSKSPTGNYSIPPVVVLPQKKLGVRPCYARIEIRDYPKGKRYLAKIQLFDLHSCKGIQTITAREFYPEHVFEDENPKIALSYLDLPSTSDDYIDARDEFLERIESFAFCHKESALWVAFQHGVIRKISFDGKNKSPYISHPGSPTESPKDPYYRTGFETPISISKDDKYITFGQPSVTFCVNEIDLNSSQEIIILKPKNLKTPKQNNHPEDSELSWITLPIDDLSEIKSLKKTLLALIQLSDNIDNLRDGKLLHFRFVCHNELISEASFFNELSKHPNLWSDLRDYIIKLCDFESPLWYDKKTPAGIFAIRTLVLLDKEYISDFTRYLRSLIDPKNEQEEPGKLVSDVIACYGWNKDTIDMILTRAAFQTGSGLDQLQVYLESRPFQDYMEIPDNQKYFRSHSLFKSLAEEYFQLLLPLEDMLFEAIEEEDINSVQSILKKEVELEIRHPDFECTPLVLAFELENQEIVKLLIDAGANIDNLDIDDLIKIVLQREKPFSDQEKANIQLTLNQLNLRRKQILDNISKIQYGQMLTFAIGDQQLKTMEELNFELESINTEIRYARLGLDKSGLKPLEISNRVLQPYNLIEHKTYSLPDSFISDISYFEEDLKATTVFIEDLEKTDAYIEAMNQLVNLSTNINELIVSGRLRFNFLDKKRQTYINEESFFKRLSLTPVLAEKLKHFIGNIAQQAVDELWYNDDIQTGIYALQALVLYDKKYIRDFVRYLKSKVINCQNEKQYPTDLIFDVLSQYGWCNETLQLMAARVTNCPGKYAWDELRLQVKKGGLREYLQNKEQYDYFINCLLNENDDIDNNIMEMINSIMPASNL